MAGEVLIGFGQCRSEGTFGQLLSHLRPFAMGCFLLVSRLMQCRLPESTVLLFQCGLSSSPRPWESFSSVYFPLVFKMPYGPGNVALAEDQGIWKH